MSLNGYPGNRGPFVARIRRLHGVRAAALDLYPGFRFGLLSYDQAQTFAAQLRDCVFRWFGRMRCDLDAMAPYVVCTADVRNRVVRVEFLEASGVARQGFLAAGPEILLALAELVDRNAAVIRDGINAL